MLTTRPTERRGNVVVLTAVSLVAILGITSLSIDGGMMLDQRRQLQATSDAAALAAASDLYSNWFGTPGKGLDGSAATNSNTAYQYAVAVATANGYTDDTAARGADWTTQVTVNIPPLSGTHVGQAGHAEVIITYKQPRYFSRVFGTDKVQVSARSVARGRRKDQSNAILVLDPSNSKSALNSGGNGVMTVNSPIQVNSSSSQAMIANGGGTLAATGGFYVNGNPGWTGPIGSFTGAINPGSTQVSDPLSNLPPPDYTQLPSQTNKGKVSGNGNVTLYPGVYDGISITGSNANVTFMPGIYYVKGGGINMTGGTITGTGVMFYNDPGSNSDQVNISTTATLSAPTSGPYQGMLLFQSRSTTITPPVSVQGSSSSLLTLKGTFYAPTALMQVAGGGTQNVNAQFISYDLNITGGGTFNVNWDPTLLPGIRQIGLVE